MKSVLVFLKGHWLSLSSTVVLVAAAIVAAISYQHGLSSEKESLASATTGPSNKNDHNDGKHAHQDDAGHGHNHKGHDEANSLELSKTAQMNIGLRTARMELRPFEKTISVPGIVAERPGRSQIDITAPMTGIVTNVYSIEGEAVTPGQRLFEVRLTHEELVTAQREFLQSAEELDVIKREVARLELVGERVVAGKTILERKYEQQKTEAALHAKQQGLLLHGLTPEQVQAILNTRSLLPSLTVVAPPHEDASEHCTSDHLFHVQKLSVKPGQHVEAGNNLCVLADHCQLLIEGTAFEQDVERLNHATAENWDVSAVLTTEGTKKVLSGLKILYVSDQVDAQSRALHFYVQLSNQVLRNTEIEGHRFIAWQFKPGQRVQLQVPVEKWPDRIVLPVEAIAQDGVETYVFRPNGDHFDRRPVHVEYRDQFSVVIANDGSLFPGDIVAMSGAQQLQLALKNKAGGGIDRHAGHQH